MADVRKDSDELDNGNNCKKELKDLQPENTKEMMLLNSTKLRMVGRCIIIAFKRNKTRIRCYTTVNR